MPRVELRRVSKTFGQIAALRDIDLEVGDGQYACLLGPTGSGKTTLLKVIAGLVAVDTGKILLDGKVSNEVPPEQRNAVYMPQNYALFPHMTAKDNIAYGLRVRGVDEASISDVIERTLELVKLKGWGNAYPHELSGGMQQRVALARCITTGSKIMLLDEPLGALDARLRLELRIELKRLAKDLGLTVVHVTHDQAEATAMGDVIILLRGGQIAQFGEPEEVYLRPSSIFAANFVGEKNIIDGRVTDVRADEAIIDLGDGLQIVAPRNGLGTGELAVVVIRCEGIHPFHIHDKNTNNIAGVVRDVRFLGSYFRYSIQLKGGKVLQANVPSARSLHVNAAIDNTIPLSIRKEDIAVFKYPERGLALEVEAI